MLPCTTKRRITTNLKSINNQKHHKIKLPGTPTTKELKKKINQNNQTSKAVDCMGRLRKTRLRQQAVGAGLAAKLWGCEGGADLREKQSQRWLWTTVVVAEGETHSLTWSALESVLETSR